MNAVDLSPSRTPAGDQVRSLARPFIHKFRTKAHHYVYDVNRNSVLKVGPVEYAIIDDYGVLSLEDMIAAHAGAHSEQSVREAYEAIARARRDGDYYSPHRPERIVYPLDEQSLGLIYENRLNSICLCVTEQCNLRCAYCAFSGAYENARTHSARRMSWETARSAIDFIRRHSMLADDVSLAFYGGEPLLHPEFVLSCMEYAKTTFDRKPLTINITTNATLLRGPICKALIEHNVQLYVSLDGPIALHDRYRRDTAGLGTFNTVCQNLQALHDLDPGYYRSRVMFLITLAPPYDFETLERFVLESPLVKDQDILATFVAGTREDSAFLARFSAEELDSAQLRRIKQDCVATLIHRQNDNQYPWKNKFKQVMHDADLELFAWGLGPTPPLLDSYHPGGICAVGKSKLFVAADGRLFPCERVNTAHDLFCLGHVDTGLDPWRAMNIIRDFTETHDRCRHCFAIRHCRICIAGLDQGGKISVEKKTEWCLEAEQRVHEHLITLMSIRERNEKGLNYIKYIKFI